MNFGLYIDNNKRELERIKRISKFEGVNQEKCKRIQRDIDRLTADRQRKLLLEGRQEQKEHLRSQIEEIKKSANEKKEQLKEELS